MSDRRCIHDRTERQVCAKCNAMDRDEFGFHDIFVPDSVVDDPAAPLGCGAYHPDHPGTRCRQPEGHSGEHATARLDVTWDNAYLSAPQPDTASREASCCELACYEDPGCACEGCVPSDPAATVCGACGHDDPHAKNGGCGADLMREGPPPYFDQCMCDGKSGSRIVRFWSDPPFDPAARVAALACPLCGRLWTSDQTGHFHSATIAAIQPPSDPAAPLDVEAEIAAALAKQAEEIAYEFRKQTPAAPLDVERLARALENISSNRPSYFSAEAIAREYALATPDLCQHMIPAAECRVGHAKADPSDPAAPLDYWFCSRHNLDARGPEDQQLHKDHWADLERDLAAEHRAPSDAAALDAPTPTSVQMVRLAESAWPQPYYASPDGLALDLRSVEGEAPSDPAAPLREAAQDTLDWLEEHATRLDLDFNCDMFAALRAALATTDLCQHMIPAAECRAAHAKADPSDPAAPLDVLHDIVCSHANRPAGHAFNFDPQGILSDCRYLRAALATEEAERE